MSRKIGLRLEIVLNITLLVGASLLFGGLLLLKLSEQQLVEQKVADVTALSQVLARAGFDPDGPVSPQARLRQVEDLLRSLPAAAAPESWNVVDAGAADRLGARSGRRSGLPGVRSCARRGFLPSP